jgi:pimeloyl-ACP methyl ester carboxylesterase
VRNWAAKLRTETDGDCVWVLGHSEGGLVALASLPDANICGLILVSAPGRRLGELLREQLRANQANAPILESAFAAIADLENGKPVDAKLDPALLPLFHPAVQGFLRDAMAYDPAKLIASCAKPVLIVQGKRDIQVQKADALRLKGASPHAELALLPDVTHVLKIVTSDDRAANLKTYQDPKLPIATSVVDAVASFILAHSAKH